MKSAASIHRRTIKSVGSRWLQLQESHKTSVRIALIYDSDENWRLLEKCSLATKVRRRDIFWGICVLGDLCVPRGENILGHSRRCWSSSFVRFLCGCWLLSRENFSRLQNLSDLLCDGDENDNIHLSCTLYSLFYPLIARFGICKQNSLTLFVHELVFCCAFGIWFFTSSIDKLWQFSCHIYSILCFKSLNFY